MTRQRVGGEKELPETHFDFTFLGDEGHPGETLPRREVSQVWQVGAWDLFSL